MRSDVRALLRTPAGPSRTGGIRAFISYRVTGVSLRGPSRASSGERVPFQVDLRTAGRAAGLHCFRVEVTTPSGEPLREYAQNVLGRRGRARFTVPFALHDSPGTWQVKVKDVASGVTQTVQIELTEP